MQPTLFPSKVMRRLKATATAKVYKPAEVFPYGTWKGKKLSVVAALAPEELERWQHTRHVRFSPELQQAIALQKFLSK